jgi:hypothetical protein
MKSTDVRKIMSAGRKSKLRKPYLAPRLRLLSPSEAKRLLSRDADSSDTELQQPIEDVDHLDGAKGS